MRKLQISMGRFKGTKGSLKAIASTNCTFDMVIWPGSLILINTIFVEPMYKSLLKRTFDLGLKKNRVMNSYQDRLPNSSPSLVVRAGLRAGTACLCTNDWTVLSGLNTDCWGSFAGWLSGGYCRWCWSVDPQRMGRGCGTWRRRGSLTFQTSRLWRETLPSRSLSWNLILWFGKEVMEFEW